jgi:hypothetical protein
LTKNIDLVGVSNDFDEKAGYLVREDSQQISDTLLTSLKDKRHDTATQREDEFMHVASIPVIFVEKWQREGFDIMQPGVTYKEIVARLKAENLEGFMATDKRI